jgi:hypothetical protein
MIKVKSGKYKHVCWIIIFACLVMVGRASFVTFSSPSETPPLYLNGRVVMK